MKAIINNENKAKFFALYFGQNVLENPLGVGIVNGRSIDYVMTNSMVAHLNLKPLSQISDEDAASLCRLFSSYFPVDSVAAVQGRILVTEYIRRSSNLTAHDWFFGLDYLRSRGYALPWMGLSVDELIKAGWILLV